MREATEITIHTSATEELRFVGAIGAERGYKLIVQVDRTGYVLFTIQDEEGEKTDYSFAGLPFEIVWAKSGLTE